MEQPGEFTVMWRYDERQYSAVFHADMLFDDDEDALARIYHGFVNEDFCDRFSAHGTNLDAFLAWAKAELEKRK